jgi:hypothetical protein
MLINVDEDLNLIILVSSVSRKRLISNSKFSCWKQFRETCWGKISRDSERHVMIQSDQKVSVHLMITIQKITSNVQSVPCQSPEFY